MMPDVVPTLSHEIPTWSLDLPRLSCTNIVPIVVSICSLLWSLLIPLHLLHALYISASTPLLTGLYMVPTWSLSGLYLVSDLGSKNNIKEARKIPFM
jgi:hypothetical protein